MFGPCYGLLDEGAWGGVMLQRHQYVRTMICERNGLGRYKNRIRKCCNRKYTVPVTIHVSLVASLSIKAPNLTSLDMQTSLEIMPQDRVYPYALIAPNIRIRCSA